MRAHGHTQTFWFHRSVSELYPIKTRIICLRKCPKSYDLRLALLTHGE